MRPLQAEKCYCLSSGSVGEEGHGGRALMRGPGRIDRVSEGVGMAAVCDYWVEG